MGISANTNDNWWHQGLLDGTATYMIRTGDGFTYVLFLNSYGRTDSLFGDIDSGYWDTRARGTSWPTGDQFATYPDTNARVFAATPLIQGREGVVNGATFNRGVVSGSWFSILGANLSPSTRAWTNTGHCRRRFTASAGRCQRHGRRQARFRVLRQPRPD